MEAVVKDQMAASMSMHLSGDTVSRKEFATSQKY